MRRHVRATLAARNRTGDRSERRDAGMTMVEVVVAAVLLGVMAAVCTAALLQGQSATVANRSRVVAAHLAAREVDLVRERLAASSGAAQALVAEGLATNAHPVTDGAAPGDPDGYVVDGMRYTVERAARARVLGSTSACEGGSTYATKLATEVEVTVTWEGMGTARPHVLRQLFAPHKSLAPRADLGLIAVAVGDDRRDPVPGVVARAVTAAGAVVATATTDSSGCAVLAVPADETGTRYDVSLRSPGAAVHLDQANDPEPVQAVFGVRPSELSRTSFVYARAGTLVVHLVGGDADSRITLQRPEGLLTVLEPDPDQVAGPEGTRFTATLWPGWWGVHPFPPEEVDPTSEYATVMLPAGGTTTLHLEAAGGAGPTPEAGS